MTEMIHLDMVDDQYLKVNATENVVVCPDCLNAIINDVNAFWNLNKLMADRLTQIYRESCRDEKHKCHEMSGNPSDEVSLASIHEIATPPTLTNTMLDTLADTLVGLIKEAYNAQGSEVPDSEDK